MPENKPSILIVEDDASIRATLGAILQHKGYNTDTAETGQEAIQKSKTKFFNLALLDIRLPDIEGKATHPTARRLAKNGENHGHRISLFRKRR